MSMFLHVGGDISVLTRDIIGIFDIDDEVTPKITRAFLKNAEKRGELILAGEDLPKSFVLTSGADLTQNVILCKASARSLAKKCE